ncbi:MAG: sugar phosphate isomerase/epimerase [Clostridia bacterium]|nr:sugar phosphate isomerase/epimerase [Clostridia bacterium]
MALPVALQLFSVRESIEKDVKGTLLAIKNAGYDGIETCGGYGDLTPLEFREYCDSIGLRIISAHTSTGDIIDDTEKTLELCKALGVSYLAIAAFWGDYQYGESGYAEMTKKLDCAGAYFKENGVQILYHNHEWEFKRSEGEYVLDLIFRDFTNDNLLPEIDVCWATLGNFDAAEYLMRYSGRCPVVHLKDFHSKGDFLYERNSFKRPEDFSFRPVGYGRVDMPAVLDASLDIGAEWVVVEQDLPAFGLSDMECEALSRSWLRTVGW